MRQPGVFRKYLFAAVCLTATVTGGGYGLAADLPARGASGANQAIGEPRFVNDRIECRCEDEAMEPRFSLDAESDEAEMPVPVWQYPEPGRFRLDHPRDRVLSGRFLGPDERIVPLDGNSLNKNRRFR